MLLLMTLLQCPTGWLLMGNAATQITCAALTTGIISCDVHKIHVPVQHRQIADQQLQLQ
jgi:hypothetical protein